MDRSPHTNYWLRHEETGAVVELRTPLATEPW